MAKGEIPQETIDITNRFFEAIDELIRLGQIRDIKHLAEHWGIGRFILAWGRKHPEEQRLRVELIRQLALEYHVSLRWLFFGTGNMFNANAYSTKKR